MALACARDDLKSLPIRRVPHLSLLERCWELRANLTTYDAVSVALAELIGAPLVTLDARLADVPGPTCSIELLS